MAECRVEVVASTPEDVCLAAEGGADRVEFCTHLASGGVTPGRGLAEEALAMAQQLGLGFRVLVRPREGDFVYSRAEKRAILREAEGFLALGVDRIVTGGLNRDGLPDLDLLAMLHQGVGLDHVVFHRAADEVDPSVDCAAMFRDAGVKSVLTSGGAAKAADGLERIRLWSDSGLQVVGGAGVLPVHAKALVEAGVEAVHASCRVAVSNHKAGGLFDSTRTEVSATHVSELVAAVRSI
ncbi:hypothetical protein N9L83_02490 [Flavobacteriales bacterium]|nr:hypothetical protein [Flavobacteriales bacterium]